MTAEQHRTFRQRLEASKLVPSDKLAEAIALVGEDRRLLARHLVDLGFLTPFQVRQIEAGNTGYHIDKYIVVDFLGRGGNSIVYKARHKLMPNRFVALKTLDVRNLHGSDDAESRFRQEIELLASFEHANVVRAYDVIQTRATLYLVLEYVDGGDLAKLVSERGRLPVQEAVGHIIQAAQGLAYAHHRGVIHCDVKPANLLLTQEGQVKLADLGIAKLLKSNSRQNGENKGLCMGTPEFMSPEQAQGGADITARSDLFSLGATLFHLLTGELPVKGGSYLHKLQHLLTGPPRPLRDSRPDVPAELAALVDRLRARDPMERPASAEETIALLEPFAKPKTSTDPRTWNGLRKARLILDLLQGQISPAEIKRRHGLEAVEVEAWQDLFLAGAAQALEPGAAPTATYEAMIREFHAKIGAQAMEIESLKKNSK